MIKTALTIDQQEQLIERIARWATGLGIGTLVSALLEINRPAAPLTANMLIAVAPLVGPLVPLPLHDLGLLLQEDGAVARIRRRIAQLKEAKSARDAAGQGQPKP